MKNLYKILLLTITIIGISTYSIKAVNITASGVIATNTIWNADTVKVTGDITVNTGVTLTVNPGTYVQFQGHFKLYVQGRLLAEGTATNKITFTALNTNIGWSGIRFYNTPSVNDTSRIEYCIISYAKANSGGSYDKRGGGLLFYNYSKAIVRNSIISNNYASYQGGGIACWNNSSPKIINNIICNNTAPSLGGGIFIYYSSPDVINNTIVNNSGGSQGGGVIAYNSTSHPKIINCIVWGNTASSYPQVGKSTYAIVENCNIEGGYTGLGNIDTIPHFVSPSSGVGYTFDGLSANWGLQSASPCRNTGIYPAGYGVTMLDVAGNFRYDEGTIDMGALEFSVSTQVCGTISSNTTWSEDVLITCDITVANGVTLTIKPGTKINFLGKYHLDVDGRLLAVGKQDSMIIFKCFNPNEGWYGIDFNGTSASNDTSKIEYCVIKHGKANGSITQDMYGGAIYINSFSKLLIRSNKVTNNWATYYGGGIYCNYSSAKIINNVIVNNTANSSYGGGIYINGSSSYTPWITNNTIANNSSNSSGCGLYESSSALPVIKNNIIWGNKDSGGNSALIEQVYPTSGLNITYSDIKGGTYSGTGNISSDPKFKNPSPGAGSTYNGANKDWSLQETSPCIDAGTPSTAGLELPPIDLLGKTRVYSTAVDIGPYEDKSSLTAACSITSNTTWDANTVNVNCDVTVSSGVKLTILPGIKVKFNGNYSLTINGSLFAEGTETDTIRFTTDNPTTGWKGIIINNPSEYSNDSTVIHNCRIEYLNYNTTYGGAVYVYSFNKARISNCLIKNNTNTYGRGGGIGLRSSQVIVKNNVIMNNNAGYGAGISYMYSYDGGDIRNNTIINNTANYQGGGIFLQNTVANVSNNIISNNKVTYNSNYNYYGGGGIYFYGYYVSTFINNIIVNNSANNGGGIMVYNDAKPQFFNNTFANNYATYYGGGLFANSNADPVFKNNIFYNDSAGSVLGGNEVNLYELTSDPKFYNCLVKGGSLLFGGTGALINFNGVYTENIDTDPLFSNPSAGQGITYDGLAADWYIDSLSPCINTGTSDVSGMGTITTDYAGNPRINRGRIDIGAYENQEDIYANCTISSNTTWEVDTIKVGCDVTVNNGVTLKILPGTYVEFQGHYQIYVQGRLLAIGTSAKPITFSVNDTTGFANMTNANGGWNGIKFNSTPNTNDTSKIIYCAIKYGKARDASNYSGFGGGLYIYNYSKVVIANSIITNNRAYYKGGGIYIESSNPVIKNSIICNNSAEGYKSGSTPYAYGGGVYMDDAYPKIYNNTIAYNYSSRYAGGIYCTNSSPVFKNNIFNKNQGYYYSINYYYYRDELYLTSASIPSFYNNNIMGGKNKIIGYQHITTYLDNIDSDTLTLFISAPDSMGAKYDGLSANWDLHQNSPCINAGTANLIGINPGSEDYVGNTRIVGDTIDIGHFEIQLSSRFITTQPVAQTACEGASASFSVVIGVSSNYQWQKDGTNINGETGSTLSLSNVTLADTGNYSCVFSNSYGSVVSDVVSLTIQTTPVITLNPISTSRCLGDSATFKVSASGTQPITYQWQNTSGNLTGSAPMAFYTVGSGTSVNTGTGYPAPYGNWYYGAKHQFIILASELTAAGISAGDIQSLAFNVMNANNCPPLNNFTINVGLTTNSTVTNTWETGLTTVYTNTSYQPTVGWNTHAFQSPIIWDGNSNLIVETCFNNSSYLSNGNASISLTATTYNSSHVYRADNTSVCSSTNTSYLYAQRPVVKILAGSGVSNYYINSITLNEATTYKCEASNVCGSQLSTGAVLTIKTPPSVSSLPGTYTLCETNPIPLAVTATGDPTPTYQWYKDSTIMTGYTNIQLNISAAAASDQGDYYCKATNECGDDSTNISTVIVNEEPDITSQSASSAVCEGQSLTLSATASGAQPLTYKWYKNSISIAGATNNTYTINSIASTDAATYVCRATNSCGYDESNGIVVTVKTPPSITSQSSSTSVCQGSSYSFSVTASGTATLTYQWFNSSGPIGSATNNSYSASAAESYYCKVTNTCGNTTSGTMLLTVNSAPSITSHPSNSTKCVGSGASFNTTASGTSPITYQWYNGSGAITGATNSTFLISPVASTDAGTYYCKATNSCGDQNTNTATLSVTTAPVITAQSSSGTVCSGSSNVFSVTATGSGTLSYQWHNSSGAIGSATNNTYSASVAETYYCVISNSCGSVTSNSMLLTVNTAPAFTTNPSSTTQCIGLGASFSVSTSGTAPITYQWYDGSGSISGATNNSYFISPVTSSAAGSYYCEATNACGSQNSNSATLTVNVGPAITAQSSSTAICSGSSSLFSITASGTPTPTYQWYDDNGSITNATNNTYSANSAGNYYCIVTNSCGNATSNIMTLTVNSAPSVSTQPSNSTKCEGQSAQFSITATGTSPLTYEWYDLNGIISGATSSSYLISPVTSADAGSYYCKVINSCGNQNSSTATLTIKSSVSITSQSGDSTKCAGSDMNFSVSTSGSNPISFQWYNYAGSIFGATSSSYTKSNVSSADAGPYYCIATNNCGSATSLTKTLSVISLPTVTSQSGNDTVCIGQSATFSITASGTQPLSYQWYKGITAINNANNNTLTISSATAQNAGSYHCDVINSCGSVSSTAATLFVNTPVTITSQTGDSTKCAGDDMQFGITASGTSPITYQWYSNTGSIFGATSNTYSMYAISASDAGSYYCITSNLCGSAQSSNKVLNVNTSPVITSQTSNTTLCQGLGMTFNVNATGSSPLFYQWYKGPTAITNATSNSYSISSVTPSDAALYHCVVSNVCGSATGNNISLTVDALPAITNQTSGATKCSGQSMTFSITTTGAAPLSYQWFINNDSLKFATNSTYTISIVDTSDIGTYYCTVNNACGSVQSNNISLAVNEAPAITSQSGSNTKCVGQSMTFNITATGTSPLIYQWYDNNGPISGATNNIYILTSIDTSVAGTYYCIVSNSCGTAQSTSKVLNVMSPATITTQSSGATKCEGENMVFTVTASGSSPIMHQWYNNFGIITGATNSSYTITTVTSANSGSYYCIATNSCGSDASNIAILTVNTAPNVTQQSSNTTVCEGQNVVFTNTVAGTQPITYNWYDNSGLISGATNSIFVIPSVDTTDVGYYYCKSTNICGDDSTSNIILTVNSPILITYQSGDSSRCVGMGMTFKVQAIGTLPITYQWHDSNGPITGATSNTYLINPVTITDAGYYYCVLTNTCGTVQTLYKTLTVHGLPVVNLGNDTTFCDGGSVILSPGFGYTTMWNTGSFNPQLSVISTGSYWCSVIDQYGCQAISDTINVNVSLPYANEQLCIVGVDSATQKNIIVWDKTPNVGIVSYNIYKESTVTNVFNLIANKDVDSLSTFIDLSSNPVAKRERYAIASIDTCANESALSPVHATMHLAVSPLLGGGWTLNWQGYEGFTVATYRIWRADVNYNWALIDSMAATTLQYNDANAPDSCYYALEIIKPGLPCVPSSAKINTNYNSSRSNIANTFLQGLVSNFNANPISGNVPLTVQFYDESLGGPSIWSWNFGDGKAGSTQNPVHVYDSIGVFDVTLTASNANGSSSSTKFGYINVTNVGVSELVINSSISVYPNPYSDITNIAYELYNQANVKVEVYNIVGERITILVDEKQMKGNYKYQFSAQDLGYSTGLYFLRIQINDRIFTKKLIEIK